MALGNQHKSTGVESVCREIIMLYGIVYTRGSDQDKANIAPVVWSRWLSANRDELVNRQQNEYKLGRLFDTEDKRRQTPQENIFETFLDVIYIELSIDTRDKKAFFTALKVFFAETEKRKCGLKETYKNYIQKMKQQYKQEAKKK